MPAGRPTELTPAVLEDVRRLLPTTLYLETVADYIGITRMSIHNWLRRGSLECKRLTRNRRAKPKESEAIYLEFFYAYKKALAEGEIYDAGIIKKAASEQWQAAAWRLERRFPKRWGKKDNSKVELTGKVQAEVVGLSNEQRASAVSRIMAAVGRSAPHPNGDGQGDSAGSALGRPDPGTDPGGADA